jgi:hypothetical protein
MRRTLLVFLGGLLLGALLATTGGSLAGLRRHVVYPPLNLTSLERSCHERGGVLPTGMELRACISQNQDAYAAELHRRTYPSSPQVIAAMAEAADRAYAEDRARRTSGK